MTIVSGHQPAYLPWLGLLHKASLCDVFIYMDDVQFLDRDFIHRNRIITPDGNVIWLTVPVDRKNSSSLKIKNIRIKDDRGSKSWRYKHWSTLKSCYGKSKYFKDYASFFEWLYLDNQWEYLSDLNLALLRQIFFWFNIKAEIIVASEHSFQEKKSDLVLEHCRKFQANTVITGTQGKNYINQQDFFSEGIKVVFQEYMHPIYNQGLKKFASHLSFVDLFFRYGPESKAIAFQDNISRDSL